MKNFFLVIGIILFFISCSGGDDSTVDEIIPQTPSIIVDKTSVNFEDTMVSKSSSAASILVESKNVNSTVEISVTDGFEISSDNLRLLVENKNSTIPLQPLDLRSVFKFKSPLWGYIANDPGHAFRLKETAKIKQIKADKTLGSNTKSLNIMGQQGWELISSPTGVGRPVSSIGAPDLSDE